MKRSTFTAVLAFASLALIVGCSNNSPTGTTGLNNGKEDPTLAISQEESSGTQIAKEAADLGQSIAVSTNMLSKSAATTSGILLSLSAQAWTYSNGWWTRGGQYSANNDNKEDLINISGYDSVQFKNAAGVVVSYPITENASSATLKQMGHFYINNILGGYIDMGRTFELSGAIGRSTTDTTFVLNGSISQYFKAENGDKTTWCDYIGTAQVANITFKKTAGGWSKPVSGTINVTSPYRIIDITFTNGSAQVTVSDKSGNVKLNSKVTF